jgi:hypothetical protein
MLIPLATTALQGIHGFTKKPDLPVDANGVPLQLDTCYAFAAQREVVQALWPAHYRLRVFSQIAHHRPVGLVRGRTDRGSVAVRRFAMMSGTT